MFMGFLRIRNNKTSGPTIEVRPFVVHVEVADSIVEFKTHAATVRNRVTEAIRSIRRRISKRS